MIDNISVGNRGGIPFVKATLTTAGSSSTPVTYTLPNHTFRLLGNIGMIIIIIPSESGTVTGVNMIVNGNTLAMNDATGAAITSLDAGYRIVFFDKSANTLQAVI